MYPSAGGGTAGYAAARTAPLSANGALPRSQGQSSGRDSGFADGPASPVLHKETGYTTPAGANSAPTGHGGSMGAPPDMLTRAFNEAVRPYTEKIEMLESELAEMQDYMRSIDQQRMEIFAWIDKRGLRPGTIVASFYLSSFR